MKSFICLLACLAFTSASVWDPTSYTFAEPQAAFCSYEQDECYCYLINGDMDKGPFYMMQTPECLSYKEPSDDWQFCYIKPYTNETTICFNINDVFETLDEMQEELFEMIMNVDPLKEFDMMSIDEIMSNLIDYSEECPDCEITFEKMEQDMEGNEYHNEYHYDGQNWYEIKDDESELMD